MHFVDFYILPIDLCVVHISQNIGGADCGEMKIQNTEQVISIIYNCNQQFLYISKFHNGKAKAVLQRRVVGTSRILFNLFTVYSWMQQLRPLADQLKIPCCSWRSA